MKDFAPAPSVGVPRPWRWLEQRIDRTLGASLNPLRQLGALAFLALWLLALSGVWLYAGFDTSASGAYASIERLSDAPWSPGGVMRSLHRYATDAFVVFTALHLLREALACRWRHFRRFSWLTGCAVLPLVAVSAVGGFWLNWDRLGQFSALATAEWLDAVPLLAQPLARNFLSDAAVSDRLFSLFVFVHLGVSLLLVFGLWFHIQRITRAAVFPPRALALGTVVMLLALCFVVPVAGQGPADLARVPALLSLDWFVLFIHPLMYATSAGFTWFLVAGGFTALLALPFLPAPARAPVAVVDPANCNGCRRCFADCPYAAITMVPHPDGHPGRELARVDADLCASCGICAGSCPSSTPFRSTAALASGIDMPQLPVDFVRAKLQAALRVETRDAVKLPPHDGFRSPLHSPPEAVVSPRPVIAFGCARGADISAIEAPDVLALPLICCGQLPPSFVEYVLREGAHAVIVASCREGGCDFRLGSRWVTERLNGAREPHLRMRVPRDRVLQIEADAGEEARLHAGLESLRQRVPGPGGRGGSAREDVHG